MTKTTAPKHIFRPKARIMVLLGDQLIKNHTLALFELIKNSYDADAGEVKVTLLDIDQKDEVGRLAASMNHMINNIGSMFKDIAGGIEQLFSSSTELSTSWARPN